ncbi:MAG: dihydrofolate reductase [Paludibacteraceae bacterium]|nr:dihydrofolate reductase [Paludibacteraceae bacterium]
MKKIFLLLFTLSATLPPSLANPKNKSMQDEKQFDYHVDRFADLEILRYQVPGFEKLSLRQKLYIYYLSLAAQEGRTILYDQNNRHNLHILHTLEAIYVSLPDKEKQTEQFKNLEVYLKRVWFSNGIHHHYATDKFSPLFERDWFINVFRCVPEHLLRLDKDETAQMRLDEILPVIFDPSVDAKRVNQAEGQDLLLTSAENYYFGVTQSEAEQFYNAMRKEGDSEPLSYGLNSRLVKQDGQLNEEIWKVGGKYSQQIENIVHYLRLARQYSENEQQNKVIDLLIRFYEIGDLKTFDDYSIQWVKETDGHVDFVNGFIETYGDPLDIKASWESIVNFKDTAATHRTETLSDHAQWFEDNSPVDARFKKKQVKGVSAKVITMAFLGGDCYPATPIGINLPNANWIRQTHGSKSVTIENITFAYSEAAKGNGFKEEFMLSDIERQRAEKYGYLADNLHTDLHECLGHGSGQLLPGVSRESLGVYGSTIEEARADLFGLYYTADPKIVELGLLPDSEAYKAEYYSYMMNGLMTQLTRILPGNNIEEAHMRNRSLIAHWVLEKASKEKHPAVQLIKENGKTFVQINDYVKLRSFFGELLAEIQRIRSTGDFNAAKNIVESYGVKVNPTLHNEVLQRYKRLNLAPYKGFVNPVYTLVKDDDNKITDVVVSYDEDYTHQHLRYDGYIR